MTNVPEFKRKLISSHELSELMMEIFHSRNLKLNLYSLFKPAPKVVKIAYIRGHKVELTGRKVVRIGLNGFARKFEMRSRVDGVKPK